MSNRNYFDKHGRLHTAPVVDENKYPGNNAYIYSGYYSILKGNGCFFDLGELIAKLPFSRHPEGEIIKDFPAQSHDEVTGACMLHIAAAKDICDFLDNNHNQFCDMPGFKPTPFYKLNPFKVIRALYKVNKAQNQRHATINYPEIYPVAFWQRPEYRWFYKRAAGRNPTILEKIVFVITRLISVLRWKKDDPNAILYFSLRHLKQTPGLKLGIEGKILEKLVARKVNKLYNGCGKTLLKHSEKNIRSEYHSDHPYFL